MITFSIAAVLLSAVAAALILQRAAGAARRSDVDPTLGIYRRQLDEIDDLAERGLLAEGELRTARAEAARRLLHAAQESQAAAPAEGAAKPSVSRNIRLAVLAGAVVAPLLAGGLYVYLGKPGEADQPFAERLKAWVDSDPSQLDPQRMAAVLQTVVKSRPTEVEPLTYLARAQAASGNLPAATETMRKATRMAPKQAELWADLGQLLVMQTQGQESAASGDAFKQAVAVDPSNAPARYHLARAKVASGDVAGGLADWRALLAQLPPGDDQRALDEEIAATTKAGHLVAPPAPVQQQQADGGPAAAGPAEGGAPQDGQLPPAGSDQRAFIQSMVAKLAARLQQTPDDPAGWARLIRSYAVLGDAPKMQSALDQAHKVFKNRPDDLKTVDNAMAGGQ
jgi:cytochrome c-type biogenesis protein CcmH